MKTIHINKNQEKLLIKEALNEYGIDVSRADGKKTVTFNPNHERGLNTSIESNPTETVENINGFDVHIYSIFQRVGNQFGDANPALYALKGENNWEMTNVDEFWERFNIILDKFISTHSCDTIVIMPSRNKLNRELLNCVSSKLNSSNIVTDLLLKLSPSEVYAELDKPNSYFMKYWGEKGDVDGAFQRVEVFFENMGEVFSYHSITDQELRKSIVNTLKVNDMNKKLYNKDINDKDILLLDDSITHGQTIKSAINALTTCYTPKSINVITMFSKLYKE